MAGSTQVLLSQVLPGFPAMCSLITLRTDSMLFSLEGWFPAGPQQTFQTFKKTNSFSLFTWQVPNKQSQSESRQIDGTNYYQQDANCVKKTKQNKNKQQKQSPEFQVACFCLGPNHGLRVTTLPVSLTQRAAVLLQSERRKTTLYFFVGQCGLILIFYNISMVY